METNNTTIASRTAKRVAAHHDPIVAELRARFGGYASPGGDVYCRCPFCDLRTDDWPRAVYRPAVGIFRCPRCRAECDGATLATAPAVRAAWKIWTPARIGALAVHLWERGVLTGIPVFSHSHYDDEIPNTIVVDCHDCDMPFETAEFQTRGLAPGSIFCRRYCGTIDAATVLDQYELCLDDLDALIVPADLVIGALERSDIDLASERPEPNAFPIYTLPCRFSAAQRRRTAHRATLDVEFGVYQCQVCRDDEGRCPGAFGTLGQLAKHLGFDVHPAGAPPASKRTRRRPTAAPMRAAPVA